MPLLVFLVVGCFAQLVDGSLGMGYGVTSASLLITLGVVPALASASTHTAEIFTSLISGYSHFRFGNVKKQWLILLAVPGVIGGVTGAWLLASLESGLMKPYVAGILLALGIVVLLRFAKERKRSIRDTSRRRVAVVGFFASLIDAMGGGGWGPIATPSLILSGNEEPRKVIGTVNMAEFFVTLAIATTFFITLGFEEYNWAIIGMLLIGGIIAAPAAAYLCKRMPPRLLGILVGIALIGFNLRTLLTTLL
jgi:uncharacterized membrane protein YfcA